MSTFNNGIAGLGSLAGLTTQNLGIAYEQIRSSCIKQVLSGGTL